MKTLENNFETREDLIGYVKNLAPYGDGSASDITGGLISAKQILTKIDPVAYCKTRNFSDGHVTKLSPYIHHGVISLNEVRNHALNHVDKPESITKFIQELAWREFWQRVAEDHPEWVWNDAEDYKTGYKADDYQDHLPEDIQHAETGISCIDHFIKDLIHTGYVHNHARMYLASYIVHFRRIKWQAGAKWFLSHLLDGDEASNNFSWQWVASTFSNKPYIFNLENVDKYFGKHVDTRPEHNRILDASYEELNKRLFSMRNDNHG